MEVRLVNFMTLVTFIHGVQSSCLFEEFPSTLLTGYHVNKSQPAFSSSQCKRACVSLPPQLCTAVNIVYDPPRGFRCDVISGVDPKTIPEDRFMTSTEGYLAVRRSPVLLNNKVPFDCDQSSSYDMDFTCLFVFEGTYGVGVQKEWGTTSALTTSSHEWLSVQFNKPVRLSTVKIWFRCRNGAQFRDLIFRVGDSVVKMYTRVCNGSCCGSCAGQNGEEFWVGDLLTDHVTITCSNYCGSGNIGLREIEFYGFRE